MAKISEGFVIITVSEKDTGMGTHDLDQDEKEKDLNKRADDKPQDNIFDIEEIQIEELTVDGICGVY